MFHIRSLLFIIICLLSLPACGSNGQSQVMDTQMEKIPVERRIEEQDTEPAAELNVSARPDTAVTTDSVTVSNNSLEACPVTTAPNPPFTPPEPYPAHPSGDYFWYGTNTLWTTLPQNGVWAQLPYNPDGYTQKVFWWREDYFWKDEPEPELLVTGRRLDSPAPPLNVSRATNAFAEDIQSAMLVGVDFPTLGCWEITGRYADSELSFVVFIAP